MEVIYCDVCNQVIAPSHEKYLLAETKVIQGESQDGVLHVTNIYDVIEAMRRSSKRTKTYEICVGCHTVLRHFLLLRKDKLELIKKEIEKLYKLKERNR